jgi:hypothetical protein
MSVKRPLTCSWAALFSSAVKRYIWVSIFINFQNLVWSPHFLFSSNLVFNIRAVPTINVTRYERQTFNCSVDSNWSSVAYNYGPVNIALFAVQDGKCIDFADHSLGRYTTYCDEISRTFYLTINNVTDHYNAKTMECMVVYGSSTSFRIQSRIYVQCKLFYFINTI